MTRTSTELQLSVKRDGTIVPDLTVALSYSGNQKFISFCLTVNEGVLCFFSAPNVRAKYYEILQAYQDGQPAQRVHTTYQETTGLGTVIPSSSTTPVNGRWEKLSHKPLGGVTTNKPWFRVIQLTQIRGVFTPYLISNVDNSVSLPRCYFNGYLNSYCFAMAYPLDASEVKMRMETDASPVKNKYRIKVKGRPKRASKIGNGGVPKRAQASQEEQSRKWKEN